MKESVNLYISLCCNTEASKPTCVKPALQAETLAACIAEFNRKAALPNLPQSDVRCFPVNFKEKK